MSRDLVTLPISHVMHYINGVLIAELDVMTPMVFLVCLTYALGPLIHCGEMVHKKLVIHEFSQLCEFLTQFVPTNFSIQFHEKLRVSRVRLCDFQSRIPCGG